MSNQSLATRAVRGAFWTGGGLGVHLIVTLIFFRILNLEDMGYFIWAQRVLVLFQMVGVLGLNDALIKYQDASRIHFSSAFWACLFVGIALFVGFIGSEWLLIIWVGRTPNIAAFFDIAKPMALIIPLASVSGIVKAILARDLRFQSIAISEVAAALIAAIVGIGLLVGGWGIKSAVWNAITREIALLGGLWIAAAWMPSLSFSWSKLKALLPFGFNVSGANLLNTINNNLDKVYFVPVLLGPVAAGLYAFAYQYTMVPLNRASVVLTRVIFPAFSVVQRNNQTLRRGYTRTITAIALLSWPALIGGFIYGREILLLVKGEEMLPALNPLRLLIVAGMLKAVGTVVGSVFLAKGKANWSFRWTLVNLIVFVPALYWGVRYGIDGIAAVLSVAAVLFLVVTQLLVNRLIDLRMSDYFKSFIGPLLTTLLVAVALVAVRSLTDLGPVEALLVGVVVGSIAYAIAIRLFAWVFVMRFWRDFRGQ